MDALLPIIIVVLVVVLVVLFLVQRRQRSTSKDVVPPPDISQPIDYTNPDIKEPETLAQRIRNAPASVRILIPLLLIVVVIICVVLNLMIGRGGSATVTPTPEPGRLSEASATLSNPTRILVQASTNLPDNTPVTAQLLEDGQPFAWGTPESMTGSSFDGRVRIDMSRAADAATPDAAKTYTVVLTATGADGGTVTTEPTPLTVPQLYTDDFYASATGSGPTAAATTAATSAPTTAATSAPTTAAAPTDAPTPTATSTLTGTVSNGGNLRSEPSLNGEVLDQNNALEVLTLLQKTEDGAWYSVTNPRGVTGWFSASLIDIDPDVAAQVPVEGTEPPPPPVAVTTGPTTTADPASTATSSDLVGLVWNGGNLRSAPSLNSTVLDQNNAGETVTLIGKSADGTWYHVTNMRGVTGWYSASLLTIDADVIAQVPVER